MNTIRTSEINNKNINYNDSIWCYSNDDQQNKSQLCHTQEFIDQKSILIELSSISKDSNCLNSGEYFEDLINNDIQNHSSFNYFIYNVNKKVIKNIKSKISKFKNKENHGIISHDNKDQSLNNIKFQKNKVNMKKNKISSPEDIYNKTKEQKEEKKTEKKSNKIKNFFYFLLQIKYIFNIFNRYQQKLFIKKDNNGNNIFNESSTTIIKNKNTMEDIKEIDKTIELLNNELYIYKSLLNDLKINVVKYENKEIHDLKKMIIFLKEYAEMKLYLLKKIKYNK